MAVTNSMTSEELLESAALDAFGLLEEYEAALYTRSFHNAPAAIQDRIVHLQAQLVSDESLLPSEEPTPALREKVLSAVTSAIEQETAQLEPLATIGSRRGMAPDVVGRISMSVSGQFWRAAAFVLCAALIVVAYSLAQLSAMHNKVAVLALSQNTKQQLQDLEAMIGPTIKDFIFANNYQRIAFTDKTGSTTPARAVLYVVEGSDKAFLIVDGLALAAEPYRLTVKDENGRSEDIQTFESTGPLMGMHVALNGISSSLKNATWQITTATGDVLLASI